MPEIPGDAVDVEKLVRGLVAAKFAGLTGLPSANVKTHRLYIDGEAQAVREMGFKHPANNKTEYRVLIIDFEGFEDTTDGCDDDPVYNLVYGIKLVVSHADRRSDDTTSTDDFARLSMTMRARVLSNRNFETGGDGGYERLRCENLEPGDVISAEQDEETLVYGHAGTFTLKVRVTPLG